MSPVPATVAEFAKKNTYGAAGIGIAAQSAYHLLMTQSETNQSWRVVLAAVVGALPPAVAALAVHMRALLRRETDRTTAASGTARATKPARTTTPVSVPAVPDPVQVPAPTLPAVSAPSITAPRPAGTPKPSTTPAATPEPVTAPRTEPVPTPADVAARVTPSPTKVPLRPTATRPAAGTPTPRPRKTAPTTPAQPLAASAVDTPVTEPKPAQPPLPMPVDPALLGKAREIAMQYRTEHGTPITANQLAARLRVNSELATQALAVLDLGPHSPTTPIPTVNGNRPKATTR
jgi:hypothetical protein